MVEHAVTIDHVFDAGTASVLAHVDPANNAIEVTVRLVPGGPRVTVTAAELAELGELFTTAAHFLQGKPDHKRDSDASPVESGSEALEWPPVA